MATGMAIMGFGGGAMIASPLSVWLMSVFSTPTHVGVAEAFVVLGLVYAFFMLVGSAIVRVPAPGWEPEGYVPPAQPKKLVTTRDVYVYQALKTPQFWLIWAVLCLNVSAGIGVLGIASPMLQEIFGGRLVGKPEIAFTSLDAGQLTAIAAIAAGFTGLLSLFNIGGRFFWASLSDFIGRKNTYYAFFVIGILLYALAATVAHAGSVALFVLFFGIILSMYGGGFATVPAYLADIFGTQFVGAIHGRLLTAWGTAGIIGPVVVNYIREAEIAAGVQRAYVYDVTLYILASFLVVGLLCNWAVKPLDQKWFMSDAEVAALQPAIIDHAPIHAAETAAAIDAKVALAWLAVGVPLAWGVWVTLKSALVLFG